MKKETLRLYSCIIPSLKRWKLFISMLWMIPGLALILYGGIKMPVEELKSWGIFIWIAGITLIAIGLIPYKKLISLENNPHALVICAENALYFLVKDKQKMKIKLTEIEKVEFFKASRRYGIFMKLKTEEKNIFFPLFTERACKTLKTYLDS